MAKAKYQHLHEVAELSSMLSVAIDSGLSLIGAIEATFSSAGGDVAAKFKRLLTSLNLGGNLYDELAKMRASNRDQAVGELVVKLQIALQFGSPIAEQLADLSFSLRRQLAQAELAESSKRENLMLLPLVFLILPVTVLFAVYPALQYLKVNY
jgi:tight adherence protein C